MDKLDSGLTPEILPAVQQVSSNLEAGLMERLNLEIYFEVFPHLYIFRSLKIMQNPLP